MRIQSPIAKKREKIDSKNSTAPLAKAMRDWHFA
jgi:hypothetical protein